MKASMIVVAVLFFAIFVSAGTYLIAQGNTNYGTTVGTDLSAYDKLSEATNLSNEITDNFNNAGVTSTDAVVSFLQGGFSTVKLTFKSMSIINDVINQLATNFQIPPFVVSGVIAILFLLIVFGIMEILFRWPL